MEELASELLKELNCDTAFSIKLPAGLPLIGGVQLDIAESVVITWVVMAVILILSIILTSNLKVHNVSRRQLVAETIVTKLEGIVTGMIGEEGKRYVPYLVSVLLYLGISNIIGLFGMKPPEMSRGLGDVYKRQIQYHWIVRYEAPYQGSERNGGTGPDEYRSGGSRRYSQKRCGRMDQELYRTHRDRNTYQYPGGVHQAPVPVYAIVW